MVRIVKTEFYKLKRYHILWAGVALMLLSVLLTLFTSMANDGSVWDFAYLTEQVIKNNMSMIFPMCISLIAGYMISREQTDDTLKNILTVPISFKKLLTGKLIVCGVLSIIFGLICSLFTIIAEMIVGFPGFEISLALKATLQITAVNFFLYLAVLPIIALTCRRAGSFLHNPCTSECGTPRRWNSQGGDEQSCFGAINDFTKRMVADLARGLHGGLKILPHGLLKTWGEPCGARVKRRCGVMTTAPAETCYVPIVRVAWQM